MGLAIMAGGAVVGNTVDQIFDTYGMMARPVDEREWNLATVSSERYEAAANLEDTRRNFQEDAQDLVRDGIVKEECFDVSQRFRSGGEYADLEASVAADLLNHPDEAKRACGDTPDKTEPLINWMRNTDELIALETSRVAELDATVERYEGYVEDDKRFSGTAWGFAAGVIAGSVTAISYLRASRGMKRANDAAVSSATLDVPRETPTSRP